MRSTPPIERQGGTVVGEQVRIQGLQQGERFESGGEVVPPRFRLFIGVDGRRQQQGSAENEATKHGCAHLFIPDGKSARVFSCIGPPAVQFPLVVWPRTCRGRPRSRKVARHHSRRNIA